LNALAKACAETARRPALLAVLVGILRIAPKTIAQLTGD
jgi:hypothetical protein